MRKLIFFVGIPLLALSIVAASHLLIKGKDTEFTPVAQNLETAEEKKVAQENPASKLPVYAGEPINFIGSDPIISQLPQSALKKQKQYLADLAEILKNKPGDFESWMAVGIHKKFFNNYQGARDAWEYAKLLSPEPVLPYLNLANLYGYYLNDFKKAEANYLAAVQRDFNNIYGSYYTLANFYRDFGFKEKAIEYYKKVLEFNPNDTAVKTEIPRLND